MSRLTTFARTTLLVGSAACLAACAGGGGGGSPPAVTFSFAAASAPVTEGAAPLSVQVVLHTSLAALATDATVDVVDAGTGSATAGSDYATFAPQSVVFPMGSVDGDVQTVALTVLDDALVEGVSETVKLRLSNAHGGGIAGQQMFTATIADIHQATLRFAQASSTTPDESTAPRSIAVELDLPPGVTLGKAVSARVSDASGGSATSGVDYTAFAPQTITFAAGSPDGSTQNVTLHILDDALIETDETARLSLSNPSAGAVIGATNLHVMTIQDDDALTGPALVASEGATGVENPLSYDELVPLGSQTVGAGPNAGTHVRISNAGGSPMDLGAPHITGTNANDFAVEVEIAPLIAPPPAGMEPLAPDSMSPLVALPSDGKPGLALALDASRMAQLAALTRTTMHDFQVPGFGALTLELRRMPSPIAEGAILRVDGVDVPGGLAGAVGDLTFWSGSALELPGSHAFLALSSAGANGFVELPFPTDRFVHIVSESTSSGGAVARVLRGNELAALGFQQPSSFCGGELEVPGRSLALDLSAAALTPPSTQPLTVADCKVAIETDYQLFQKFGSTPAATNYVTSLMAAVSDRYFTDIQTTLSIAYLGLYSSAADPWTSQDSGGDAAALLNEFVSAWAPNNWPVPANLAHFISGASLGGGIAYINVLCNSSFGFGVSGNINGSINWGAWTGQPGNFTWDFVVVAHEIGHNFGSNHTHSYCPPLDLCYSNCNGTTLCSQGTIMSYCHVCGGMDNIDLVFHPVCANIMRQAVNSSCLGLSALAGGDYVQYLLRFDPLTATGVRTANLEFEHDATNEPQPFHIRLQGTAN